MFSFGSKKTQLSRPFDACPQPLSTVPDEIVASEVIGPGFAVVPAESAHFADILAPTSGTILTVFKTGHAFALKSEGGLEVLVHIGIDTIGLNNGCFIPLKAKGEHVREGEPVIRTDLAKIRAAGLNPSIMVILMDKKAIRSVKLNPEGALVTHR